MLDINARELLVLLAVALVVLGPERLPQYAQQLARLVRELRRMALGAREQVRQELGPEFDDVDWQKLDPRQYDPRRIVRDALSEAWEDEPATAPPRRAAGSGQRPRGTGSTAARTAASGRRTGARTTGRAGRGAGPAALGSPQTEPAPFDPEAT